MKNKSIFVVFMFGFSLIFLQLQAQTDSLSVKPLIVPQDSVPVAYEWTARSPLSAAEKQQRADNRAEVEEMKRRFRAFHETVLDEKEEEATVAEDQDYLWGEGKQNLTDELVPKGNSDSKDIEELRREINRNFQNSSTPQTPVSPTIDSKNINTEWETDVFQTTPPSNVEWQLNLDQHQNAPALRLAIGQKIILEQVQFEVNSAQLSIRAKNALNRWLLLFQQHPGMKIELGAHANQNISYTQALELTARRARVINNYLISLGISEQQLVFRAYGKLFPLFLASDQGNQQKNERIEVIILELPNR